MQATMTDKLLDPSVWDKRYFDGAWKRAPVTINVREPATGIELGVAGAERPSSLSSSPSRPPARSRNGPRLHPTIGRALCATPRGSSKTIRRRS